MKKYGKPLQYIIIKHKFLFILTIAVTLTAVFICFPRNVKNLLVHSSNTTIEIIKTADDKQEAHEIILNENQQTSLLELFQTSYVRLKIFHKNYVTANYMGYLIMLPGTTDTVYLLSSDIISINETQYKVYGQTFANKFKSIIENKQ